MTNIKQGSDPFDGLTKEERMQLLNDAMDNWLEKKWLIFSKWSLRGILAFAFGYLVTHVVWR